MKVLASARIAVRALRANKLRSALTLLGIAIGVGAVITMVTVGAGAQARVAEQIQSLGANIIIIRPGAVNLSGVRLGAGAQATLSEDDAWAIQREVPLVDVVAPYAQPLRGAPVGGSGLARAHDAAGRDRLGFAAGGWYRYHEHHARLGHGAHAPKAT